MNHFLPPVSPAFAVVDLRCRIRYVSGGEDSKLAWIVQNGVRLQPDVEAFVRELAADEHLAPASVRLALIRENHVLRSVRGSGSDGTVFVLTVEEDRNASSLLRTARRYQLTGRETEVLALILDGLSAGEIAGMLALSEHTVQGYFKRLLFKTGARNRVAMVAAMFDWDPQRRDARQIPVAPPQSEAMLQSLA